MHRFCIGKFHIGVEKVLQGGRVELEAKLRPFVVKVVVRPVVSSHAHIAPTPPHASPGTLTWQQIGSIGIV